MTLEAELVAQLEYTTKKQIAWVRKATKVRIRTHAKQIAKTYDEETRVRLLVEAVTIAQNAERRMAKLKAGLAALKGT